MTEIHKCANCEKEFDYALPFEYGGGLSAARLCSAGCLDDFSKGRIAGTIYLPITDYAPGIGHNQCQEVDEYDSEEEPPKYKSEIDTVYGPPKNLGLKFLCAAVEIDTDTMNFVHDYAKGKSWADMAMSANLYGASQAVATLASFPDLWKEIESSEPESKKPILAAGMEQKKTPVRRRRPTLSDFERQLNSNDRARTEILISMKEDIAQRGSECGMDNSALEYALLPIDCELEEISKRLSAPKPISPVLHVAEKVIEAFTIANNKALKRHDRLQKRCAQIRVLRIADPKAFEGEDIDRLFAPPELVPISIGDEGMIAATISVMLKQIGYEILPATVGKALRRAREGQS